jgi:hypothetical protein
MTGTNTETSRDRGLLDRVVNIVDYQTSPQQPDSVREAQVVQTLTGRTRANSSQYGDSGEWEYVSAPEDVRDAIATAVAEDRIETTDPDDETRYRLPDA